MKKDFIPYGHQSIDRTDVDAVCEVLQSDFLTQGPVVERFENTIAEYTGSRFSVVVSNGTAALDLAVAALDLAGPGEGITSPITFVASANCIVQNGLRPVFADIDPKTYNLSADEVIRATTAQTKLIVAVDFAGQPADVEEIANVARERGVAVVEDAAHALGSRYSDGSKVGSCKYSDMTIFSFHPVKTVTTAEGGAITTNDERLYRRLLRLRSHGIVRDSGLINASPGPWYYEMQDLGHNYRMSDLQAALGISQFRRLDQFRNKRREIVDRYNSSFKDIEYLKTPFEKPGVDSTFHLYVLQFDFEQLHKTRAEVMAELKSKGIGTQVHYIPVHLQPFYTSHFGFKRGNFRNAESYYERALSIPLYPAMTYDDVDRVVESIRALGSGASR